MPFAPSGPHRPTQCLNQQRTPRTVVRQPCGVFVSHWVSRHAWIVRWKCALVWEARSCLAVVHMRRVWVAQLMVYRVPGVAMGASPRGGGVRCKWRRSAPSLVDFPQGEGGGLVAGAH